jgi:hypothetical protein
MACDSRNSHLLSIGAAFGLGFDRPPLLMTTCVELGWSRNRKPLILGHLGQSALAKRDEGQGIRTIELAFINHQQQDRFNVY